MSKPQQSFHFPQLDFIKGLAIVLIVAFHTYGQLSGWHMNIVDAKWLFNFMSNLNPEKLFYFAESYFYLGVNLFVIASGFGLALSEFKRNPYPNLSQPFNWKEFTKKRILRLLPAVILANIFVFLFKGILLDGFPTTNLHLNLFPFLAGLNLFSDQWFFPPINGETWFLGLIIQLYIFFPVLMYLFRRLGPTKFLIILLIFSAAFRTFHYFYLHQFISTAGYGWSLGRLFEFGVGIYLANHLYHQTQNLTSTTVQSPNPPLIFLLPLLLLPGYFFTPTYPFTDALLGVALFTLIFQISTQLKPNSKLNKLMTLLSTQSYMIFLIHHPIIWLLQKHLPPNQIFTNTLLLQTTIFLITLITATLLSILFNRLLAKLEK